MQLCSSLEVAVQPTTAAECLAFAQSRAPAESDGVTAQLNIGVITETTEGLCIFNSGSSNTWQLVSTSTLAAQTCDNQPTTFCACKPHLEYITLSGTDMGSYHLGFETNSDGVVMDDQMCCEACAIRPPPAPPAPPFPPAPPSAPRSPPHPLYPSGTLLAQAASANSAIIEMNPLCQGIVISDDGFCHLLSQTRQIQHDGSDGTLVKAREVFVRAGPPPPPYEPQYAVCLAYERHFDERLPADDVLPYSWTIVTDTPYQPSDCCSRCDQEETCQGFMVVRSTGVCSFYGTRYATQTNQVQYGITSWTKHWPPS